MQEHNFEHKEENKMAECMAELEIAVREHPPNTPMDELNNLDTGNVPYIQNPYFIQDSNNNNRFIPIIDALFNFRLYWNNWMKLAIFNIFNIITYPIIFCLSDRYPNISILPHNLTSFIMKIYYIITITIPWIVIIVLFLLLKILYVFIHIAIINPIRVVKQLLQKRNVVYYHAIVYTEEDEAYRLREIEWENPYVSISSTN